MQNYYKLKTRNPFSREYIFIDCEKYLADDLFIKHKVQVNFKDELAKDGTEYRIIHCTIRKRDESKFLAALSEINNKMSLMGYKGYEECCEAVIGLLLNGKSQKGDAGN